MRRATTDALHQAAARNLAAWHTSSTAALGLRPRIDERWWTCATPAPNVYYSAISVAPATNRRGRSAMVDALRPHVDDPDTVVVSVCDAWDQLDLRTVGLERRSSGRWLMRTPPAIATTPERSPTRLRIEGVVDRETLVVFERTMVAGFGARPPIGPYDINGPAILDDPAMHVLGGWVGDEMVACAMAYRTDVVGIYGVATIPARRRHGFGAAMTAAAAAIAPTLVAVLQPTPEAGSLYESLGFTDLGVFSHWA